MLTYIPGEQQQPAIDDNGDWVLPEGSSISIQAVSCRAEMNGNNRTVARTDGSKLEYAFKVYLPSSVPVIQVGKVISVKDGETELLRAVVKQFDKGQMHNVIYV